MGKAWRNFSIGKITIKIDSEDYERVAKHTWRVRRRDDSDKLAIITSLRTKKGVRNIALGKFLMKPPSGKLVYPRRYFEGFDFRKENLIVCSVQERQTMLPKKRKDTTSKYRGVSYSKKTRLWRAGVTVDGRSINLGDYEHESSAAAAYNKASKKYFGDNGYQNTITRKGNRRTK